MIATDRIAVPGLSLEFGLVPWDTAACGFPVAQITDLVLDGRDLESPAEGWRAFEAWRDRADVRLVSCRLPENRLRESMWLEAAGFRCIELVLQTETLLSRTPGLRDLSLQIGPAAAADLPHIASIAEEAFTTDRFSVDFRLPKAASGRRYRRWVESVPTHPTQRLVKIEDDGRIVGFFIVESVAGGTCYWHLTAVAPACQGRGYGKRIWRAMLDRHRAEGMERILTTIAVRNTPVVNLYAGLGFRFAPPQMTLHWVRT
ncbi:MAG: GNAT family N-acetyltransferase [Verrucomicrobia bacterium]|nr:MAG: GNAT family N-acetyltransferase [Verrucomicrobiota bacterium]